MTVTSEGYPFILAAIAVGVLMLRWNLYSGVFFLVLSLFFVWFFRLPTAGFCRATVVVSRNASRWRGVPTDLDRCSLHPIVISCRFSTAR